MDTQQEKNVKAGNDLEAVICKGLGVSFNTQYNWSLVLATIVIWIFTGGLFPYSANNNFDMTICLQEYIKFFSLTALIIGFLLKEEKSLKVTKPIIINIGIITYIISLLTVVMLKNFGILWWFGFLILKPLSIFGFLLLAKQLVQIVSRD